MKKMALLLLFCMLLTLFGCGKTAPATSGEGAQTATSTDSDVSDGTEIRTDSRASDTTSEPTAATGTESGVTDTKKDEKKPVYSVLFIGNSYTNRSSLWELVKNVAKDQGYTMNVDTVVKGSYTLQQMADPSDELGAQVEKKLKSKSYDFVFIQEQSERPATEPGLFYDAVRLLNKKIKANGATPILFQTWGRKAGNASLSKNGWTPEQMTRLLAQAYEAIGKECNIAVSPVGTAFWDVYQHHPEIDLYDTDLHHPSPAGSYLAALCHYAMIYQKSPVGVTYRYGVTTEAEAKILQQAANQAVFGARLLKDSEIPDSSKISGSKNGGTVSTVFLNAIPAGSKLISAGIKGDKGLCSSTATAASGEQLTSAQLEDLADIGYGISIIGTKDMVNPLNVLNDGYWATKSAGALRTSYHFADGNKHYGIEGKEDAGEKYRALITLNFGKTVTVDAVGYCSGSLGGFAQAQDVFVSSDGKTWAKVESLSYTTTDKMPTFKISDPSGGSAGVTVLFDAGGVKAKYVRIGIVTGVTANAWDMNTLEFLVYGKD